MKNENILWAILGGLFLLERGRAAGLGKIVEVSPPGQALCKDGTYSTFSNSHPGGVCSYHGGRVENRSKGKFIKTNTKQEVELIEVIEPETKEVLEVVEVPTKPDNYYLINADRKAELHLQYQVYKNLPFEQQKEIKRYFLFSRPKSAWISKGHYTGYSVQEIIKKLELPLFGKEERRSFAESMERKQSNAERRIDRFETRIQKSERRQKELQAEFNRYRKDWAWLTQPITPGKGGEAFKRHKDRVMSKYEKGFEEMDKQKRLRERIEASAATAEGVQLKDPNFLQRRIKDAQKELRKIEKNIIEYQNYIDRDKDWSGDPMTEETKERYLNFIEKSLEELEYQQGKLFYYTEILSTLEQAGEASIFNKETLKNAEFIKRKGSWHKVIKLNPTTVTHNWFVGVWKTPYSDIQDAVFKGENFKATGPNNAGSYFVEKNSGITGISGIFNWMFPGIRTI